MIKRTIVGLALAIVAVLAGSPAYATGTGSHPANCQAYVYKGTAQNLCDRFPGTGDVDCAQIGKPVELVKVGVDPWHLNRDADRYGCDTPPSGQPSGSPSGSASPSTSPSTSASASPSESATPSKSVRPDGSTPPAPGVAGPSLPLTGPSIPLLVGGGLVLLLLGLAGYVAVNRRRTQFRA